MIWQNQLKRICLTRASFDIHRAIAPTHDHHRGEMYSEVGWWIQLYAYAMLRTSFDVFRVHHVSFALFLQKQYSFASSNKQSIMLSTVRLVAFGHWQSTHRLCSCVHASKFWTPCSSDRAMWNCTVVLRCGIICVRASYMQKLTGIWLLVWSGTGIWLTMWCS